MEWRWNLFRDAPEDRRRRIPYERPPHGIHSGARRLPGRGGRAGVGPWVVRRLPTDAVAPGESAKGGHQAGSAPWRNRPVPSAGRDRPFGSRPPTGLPTNPPASVNIRVGIAATKDIVAERGPGSRLPREEGIASPAGMARVEGFVRPPRLRGDPSCPAHQSHRSEGVSGGRPPWGESSFPGPAAPRRNGLPWTAPGIRSIPTRRRSWRRRNPAVGSTGRWRRPGSAGSGSGGASRATR
jgi:hypothetical protein